MSASSDLTMLSVAPASLVATPTVPAHRSAGCAITTHSGVGLYEVTLDQPLNVAECAETLTLRGGVADQDGHVEHVSDTVKRIRTDVAGAPSDAVAFACVFHRLPAGH
jgi:hypothetical protein